MGLISRVSSRTYRDTMVKFSGLFGAFSMLAGYVAAAGVKVESNKCSMLMFLDDVKVSGKSAEIKASTADPCTVTNGDRVVTLVVGGKSLVLDVQIKGPDYAIKKTTFDGKEYVPAQSKKTSNTYTFNPNVPIGSTFVCQYTTFREKVAKLSAVYSAPTISFGTFSMLVNAKGDAPKNFKETTMNQCVGILDEATILGLLTFLLLSSVIMFALCMMAKMSPMDRFESPKDRPISVPMDKSK